MGNPEEDPKNTEHVGDGVYVTFDGFGFEIRVNDHRNEVAVYLEPSTLKSLIQFTEKFKQT